MKHGAPFTEEEDDYLKQHYADTECVKLSLHLKRSVSSTQNRLRHLGLRKRQGEAKLQKKASIFFDMDLVPKILSGAQKAGLSMSAFVQELVRAGLKKSKA